LLRYPSSCHNIANYFPSCTFTLSNPTVPIILPLLICPPTPYHRLPSLHFCPHISHFKMMSKCICRSSSVTLYHGGFGHILTNVLILLLSPTIRRIVTPSSSSDLKQFYTTSDNLKSEISVKEMECHLRSRAVSDDALRPSRLGSNTLRSKCPPPWLLRSSSLNVPARASASRSKPLSDVSAVAPSSASTTAPQPFSPTCREQHPLSRHRRKTRYRPYDDWLDWLAPC
jgi:hypothetical protein